MATLSSRIKMANSLLSLIAFFLISCSTNGQGLTIRGLRYVQSVTGKIVFELVNESNAALKYYLSLEQSAGDTSWIEVRGDLFKEHYSRKSQVFSIGERSARTQYFNLKRSPNDLKAAKYRIAIRYFKNFNSAKMINYSPVFLTLTLPK